MSGNQYGSRATDARTAPAANPSAEQPPLSQTASSRRMREAVTLFKQAVNVDGAGAGANITDHGQFFWIYVMRMALEAKARDLTTMDYAAEPFATLAISTSELIRTRDPAVAAKLRELDLMSRTLPVNAAARAAMRALVAPAIAGGPGLEYQLWKALNRDPANKVPAIPRQHLSFRAAWALADWEKGSCGTYAVSIVKRLRLRTDHKSTKGAGFQRSLVGGSPWGMRNDAIREERMLGDVVYQRDTKSVVEKMKAALDSGEQIHARVLSGKGYGTTKRGAVNLNKRGEIISPSPPQEHSLVIIGHNGIDMFVFHDPDASVSHTPEAGFGVLFYDPAKGRLSTATSEFGLAVNDAGRHMRGDKRYQVLSVFTF